MKSALRALDAKLDRFVTLIMGGGGAMILAHGYPRGTTDIDAIPVGGVIPGLDDLVKEISAELSIPVDWLNPYFSTFAHVLPSDYDSRLIQVFKGTNLEVKALGREDMLIMKCFAGRQKDIPHAKALLKAGVNLALVEKRMEELVAKLIPRAVEALDFLDEVKETD